MTVMRDDENTSFLDDMPDGQDIPEGNPMQEMGVTGIKRTGGYIDEEFLPALRGRKAIQVYKEMSLNDSMVGAMLFAIDKLIREVEWKVVPAEQSEEGQLAADFLESCMEDMSHSWDDFIGEVLSMLAFGWSWHEIVYKRRMGPWEKDGSKKSKYEDGLIGWRKMPIRAQETWQRWIFDESGGIKGMVQMAPPKYQATALPIEKSLLFRTNVSKGNPEGQSLLRTAYRSWYFKKRLEEFEAIGVERDLAGMPVARVPADYLNAKPGTKQHATVQAFRKMVRGVRRDENEGLVLPRQIDPETKQDMYDFELMSSGGSRQFDTTAIIQRYEQRILMAVLADFILVGHEQVGSYSMHTDKTGIFRAALNAITKTIADTLNRHAVPKLFELNSWKLRELPKFEPMNIDPPDLTQLSQFISSTAGAGMQWFPDPELEKFIRDIARLPEMSDEDIAYKREMLQQTQAMEYGQAQMENLGLQQKAEMTAQGMTPEQAEMQSQMPTEDQQAQQQAMQAPPEDPNADANHQRETEKMTIAEQQAQAAHGRDTEKMTLQEKMAEKQHQREVQMLREKDRQDGKADTRARNASKLTAKQKEREAKTAPAPGPSGAKPNKKTIKKDATSAFGIDHSEARTR